MLHQPIRSVATSPLTIRFSPHVSPKASPGVARNKIAPSSPLVQQEALRRFLRALGPEYAVYERSFVENGITTIDVVQNLVKHDLITLASTVAPLGISST